MSSRTAIRRHETTTEHDARRLRECRWLALLSYVGCLAAVALYLPASNLADRADPTLGPDAWSGFGGLLVLFLSPLWLLPAAALVLATLLVRTSGTAATLVMTIAVGSALLSVPPIGASLLAAHGDPAATALLLLDALLVWIPMGIVIAKDVDV